jgi:hypothetical protein
MAQDGDHAPRYMLRQTADEFWVEGRRIECWLLVRENQPSLTMLIREVCRFNDHTIHQINFSSPSQPR